MNHRILQNLLTISINSSENELANASLIVAGVNAQTGSTGLSQQLIEDVTADYVTIGLLRMSVEKGFYHFTSSLCANVFADGRAERAGSRYGFVYVLVHGNQFVGNE